MIDFEKPLWSNGRPAFPTGQSDTFSIGEAFEVITVDGTFWYSRTGRALEGRAPSVMNSDPVDWDRELWILGLRGQQAAVMLLEDDASYLGDRVRTVRTPDGVDMEFFENGRPRWDRWVRWAISNNPFDDENDLAVEDDLQAKIAERNRAQDEAKRRVAEKRAARRAQDAARAALEQHPAWGQF